MEHRATLYLISIATNKTLNSAKYIKDIMKDHGWRKASENEKYEGLRGLYLKEFDPPNDGHVLADAERDYSEVIGVIQGGIQRYAKPTEADPEVREVAKIHSRLLEGVLCNQERMNMLNFPFANVENEEL